MIVLELSVPEGGYPAGLQDCPTCGKRLMPFRRYLRVTPTDKGDAIIEFKDSVAAYNGKRMTPLLVPRERLKKVGLELRIREKLSHDDRDLILRLALQGIEDIQIRWRWLRDSTTVWYKHPPTADSCRKYKRISQLHTMPSTFEKWVAPLLAALYVCGYSYMDIAKQIRIDTTGPSKGRSTVSTAIKSLLREKKISPERMSEAHKRNQGRSTCILQKGPHKWVLVIESAAETDQSWFRVLWPDLGIAVRTQDQPEYVRNMVLSL